MNLHSTTFLSWLRSLLHSAAFAGLILIAASWFVVTFVSSVEREKALDSAMKQSDGLVRLFEQSTEDTLDRFDRTLLLLRKSFEDDPAHFDLEKWIEEATLGTEEKFRVTVIGADGFQIKSSPSHEGPPIWFGDRAYFQEQMEATND